MTNESKKSIWRNGYVFGLILLAVLGISIIVIGAGQFADGTVPNEILIGIGVSFGPAALVAVLFRIFLFDEVQYQLTNPVLEEIKETLSPEIKKQVKDVLSMYREEIELLKIIKEAGIVRPYRSRGFALKQFVGEIQKENFEIFIVGSSLKGLLQNDEYQEIRIEIEKKIENSGAKVLFLLTHPMVADLRAEQEARRPKDIGTEIIESLKILDSWGVPPDNVRLYKGTPTCFAIKTSSTMLLNTYPYGEVAYESPCLIVEKSEDNSGYFFNAFEKAHFGVWDKDIVEKIDNLKGTIQNLTAKMKVYSENTKNLFNS